MEIREVNTVSLVESARTISQRAATQPVQKKTLSTRVEVVFQRDQVEISKEGKELQNSNDTMKVAKKLLANLPSVRAQVIYEALAKLKAGLYPSDKILSEATSKLPENSKLK